MVLSLVPIENFPNEFMAILFSFLFIFILIMELSIFTKQRLAAGKKHDAGSLIFILLGVFVPLIIIFILAYTGVGRTSTTWSYLGLIFLLIGFSLRQWSIKTLGKFFTPVVSIQKGHKLIEKGPYKYVRHPSYTGLLLELVGVGLFLSNLLAAFVAFIFLFPSIVYRISTEETVLIRKFGKKYLSYKGRTKKFIPFVY